MSNSSLRMTGVTVICENDIVCGRGGAALKHSGNLAYRKIVNINKTLYATCLKAEKLRISKSIVAAIREVNGRFLEREDGKISTTLDERNPDGSPVTWCDIGDRRAIEKTSQALREGQPKLLKKLQQTGQVDEKGPANNGFNGGYQMPMGVQPAMQQQQQLQLQQPPMQQQMNNSMPPPLPQINVPMDNQGGYDPQRNNSYGSNPSYLKQDSFQMMIGETLNVNQNMASQHNQAQGGDPFSGHNSMGQPPVNNSFVNSYNPHDSWQADPTPLPYHIHSSITMGKDESKQLLHALDLEGSKRSSVNSSSCVGSTQSELKQEVKPRFSVSFKRDFGRDSIMSLGTNFSELSNWDTQSLDDAMDVAEREIDLKLLGSEELDFDWGDTYYENNYGLNAQQQQQLHQDHSAGFSQEGGDGRMRQRGSILRRNSRYTRPSLNNFGAAAMMSESADPGMLFTSTFDTRPGGVNAGTDVSGLIGERRKSAVAFELRGDQQRRQSRLSNMRMMTEIGQMFKRDFGSTMSIQTADIKDLIDCMDDDD
jgi:hypothetical protein